MDLVLDKSNLLLLESYDKKENVSSHKLLLFSKIKLYERSPPPKKNSKNNRGLTCELNIYFKITYEIANAKKRVKNDSSVKVHFTDPNYFCQFWGGVSLDWNIAVEQRMSEL